MREVPLYRGSGRASRAQQNELLQNRRLWNWIMNLHSHRRRSSGDAMTCRQVPADRVQRLGFRVQGSGFRVQGSGFKVQGSGFRVQGSGFRVQGSGFRVQGLGFRV